MTEKRQTSQGYRLLSAFYIISQRNFGMLLILWCSLKLWWHFYLDLFKSTFRLLRKWSIEILELPFVPNVLFFRVWPTLKHFNNVHNIFVLTGSGAEDILQILIIFSRPTPKGTVYFYSPAPHAQSISTTAYHIFGGTTLLVTNFLPAILPSLVKTFSLPTIYIFCLNPCCELGSNDI
jgi:hypothetical protein